MTTSTPFQDTTHIRTSTLRSIHAVNGYTHFLLLLISFVLTLAAVMCAARIIFVYCTYKRRRGENEIRRGHRTVAAATETDHSFHHPPDGGGIANYGFTDLPPRYDQICKEDEPPPLYESLRGLGRTTGIAVEERGVTDRCTRAGAVHSQGGGTQLRIFEQAPSYCATDRNPPERRPASDTSGQIDTTATTDGCGMERVVVVSDESQRIQNHMDAVRERYSGNVEQVIASLSVTSPPLTSPSRN
ncbi:hypothetical protein Y032_0007g3267 [Ancylostoma ceylanicum]|nr:hypothetical protein Y032_0007g3267 [Ancylostoma ceylanicum]